jgi:hypothetical protein
MPTFSLDRAALDAFDRKLIDDLKASLDASGSTASGRTKDSLRSEISENRYKLFGRAYIGALEFGRKPTSGGGDGSLKTTILQWIKDKGITPKSGTEEKDYKSMAYAITRKIHQSGTLLFRTGRNYQGQSKPTQIINGVIQDGRIKSLSDAILLHVKKQVITELRDAYGNSN